MWNNYFLQIQRKYSMRVSGTKPLVIRLDGKAVTRNKNLDLLNDYEGSFLNQLKKSAIHFSKKYECLCIFGSDEISFITKNPMLIINDTNDNNSTRADEIVSLFSQFFFDYFNSLNDKKKIFWHVKCFSISEEKINSYLKYRSSIIRNAMSTYYLIRKDAYTHNEKLDLRLEKSKQFPDYNIFENIKDGILYYNGERIDLEEFYNGNIKYVELPSESPNDTVLDLLDF